MTIDVESVVTDARWLPHRLIDGGRVVQFIDADREAQRSATFLDDTHLGKHRPRINLSTAAMAAALRTPSAPAHFIFHSAFARSTLLARALDIPGVAMGLKEPIILNDAAELYRQRLLAPDLPSLVLRLLGRPLTLGESIIVKPSNIVNSLMPTLMQAVPGARALLLYRDIGSYLRSIARKGMFGRIWARRLLLAIKAEAPFDAGFSEADLFTQSDLQVAALGWLIQHALFAALARTYPDRVRLLDAEALVTDRRATFAAVTRWFDLALGDATIDAVVNGPAFAEDSKRIGERFGADGRPAEAPVDEAEIEMVTQWALAVARHVGLRLDFGPRLVPEL